MNPQKKDTPNYEYSHTYPETTIEESYKYVLPKLVTMCCVVKTPDWYEDSEKFYDKEHEIPHKSWITITAEIHVEFAREYKGKGPVLYPISIEPAEKPEDELVYFS